MSLRSKKFSTPVMLVCWFASFHGSWDAAQVLRGARDLGAVPGLVRALAHVPARATDPFLRAETGPALVLQLYFGDLGQMEAAVRAGGPLAALGERSGTGGADAASITQQAMAVRPCLAAAAPAMAGTTYLVGYEGPAADTAAWLGHYLRTHATHLTELPGVREVEVYTRLDWCPSLPWPADTHLQRNKVVFASPEALAAALDSPVRARMREDFLRFPAHAGAVTHWPMATRSLLPAGPP